MCIKNNVESRNYDPEWCRWLNSDDVSFLEFDNICGINLFVYCNGTPIYGYDPDGNWNWGNLWKIVGGVALIGSAVAISLLTRGAAAGTILAAIHAASTTAAVTATATAVINGFFSGLEIGNNGISFDFDKASDGFFSGTVNGLFLGGTGGLFSFAKPLTQFVANGLSAGMSYYINSLSSKEGTEIGALSSILFSGIGTWIGLNPKYSQSIIRTITSLLMLGTAETIVDKFLNYDKSNAY